MIRPADFFKETPIFRSKKLWIFLGVLALAILMKIALPANEKSYTNEEKKLNHEKVLAIIAARPSPNLGGKEKNGQLNLASNMNMVKSKSLDVIQPATLLNEALGKNANFSDNSQLKMETSKDGNQSESDSTEEKIESDLNSQADQEIEAVDKSKIPTHEKLKEALTSASLAKSAKGVASLDNGSRKSVSGHKFFYFRYKKYLLKFSINDSNIKGPRPFPMRIKDSQLKSFAGCVNCLFLPERIDSYLDKLKLGHNYLGKSDWILLSKAKKECDRSDSIDFQISDQVEGNPCSIGSLIEVTVFKGARGKANRFFNDEKLRFYATSTAVSPLAIP